MLDQLRDVFKSLSAHDVRYLVIGGIAAVLHGVPRATFDLDILIEATPENAARLLKALQHVNFGTAALVTPDKLLSHEITIFKDRVRIDVQTATPGISFHEAWDRRVTMVNQGQEFYVLSKQDLVAAKKASARPIDLEDVRSLDANKDER